MSKNDFDEKEEKRLGKNMRRKEEKEEKSVEEKWQRDQLGSVTWALILIWAGVVFLANNLGFLDVFNQLFSSLGLEAGELPFDPPLMQIEAWSLVFLGAGALLLIEVVIRLLIPSYRKPVLGTVILAIVFFGMGLGSWGLIWPLILIAVGLAIVLGGFFRKEK